MSEESLVVGPATLSYWDSLGPYTVVERVALGGYSEIYRAWDRDQERDVALKVLRPEMLADETARRGLRQEAEALARLHHPNIAELYGYASADGIDFLVTEYVTGTPLAALAAQLGSDALPEGVVTHLGAQIADAVAAAHENGILHRDLKTSNVLVTPDAQVKLIDFGLARAVVAGATSAAPENRTPSESPKGTLPYRAPEILQGGDADERSDIYSLGVVLYKVTTGRWPFWGEDEEELSEALRGQAPRPPGEWIPGLNPALEQLILKCLQKDPGDRFPSCRDLAAELKALTSREPFADGWERLLGTQAGG